MPCPREPEGPQGLGKRQSVRTPSACQAAARKVAERLSDDRLEPLRRVRLAQHRLRSQVERLGHQTGVIGTGHHDHGRPDPRSRSPRSRSRPLSPGSVRSVRTRSAPSPSDTFEGPLDGGHGGRRVAGLLEQQRGENAGRKVVVDDEDPGSPAVPWLVIGHGANSSACASGWIARSPHESARD